jgi:hypothetical protein
MGQPEKPKQPKRPKQPPGAARPLGEDEVEGGLGVLDDEAAPPEPTRRGEADDPGKLEDREIGSDPPGPGPILPA